MEDDYCAFVSVIRSYPTLCIAVEEQDSMSHSTILDADVERMNTIQVLLML